MKLFVVSGSPNCRKVVATVHALGLEVTEVVLDPRSGALKAKEFLAINPNGKVPVLDDDGFVLWESNAIVQYLGTLAPNRILFPEDPKMRANVLRWQFWETAHFGPASSAIVRENYLKPKYSGAEPDPVALEAATKSFHQVARILEGHLSTRRFLLGDALTVADFSLASHLTHAGPAKIPLDGYKAICAWYERVETEPAWARSAPPAAV